MSRAVIIDTETTGTDDDDQIIEAAMISVEPDLAVLEHITQRYRPTIAIKFGAMATHHIHESDLVGYPTYKEQPLDFEGIDFIIGHKVDFDWQMLGKPPVRRICTFAIARYLWPNLDSHTLGALMYFTQGLDIRVRLKDAHQALEDCYFVYDFLDNVRDQGLLSWNSWEELWNISQNARIPTIMTFGKHKGKAVGDVDMGYRHWYSKQPDADPWLLKAWGYRVDIPE
jgi:exodeoxyribonuclease X